MMVACLGWGSLIWNPEDLCVQGDWNTDGPVIPVEFARQSDNGRITLVVTPGAPNVTVLWARLGVENIEAAKQELARREGIKSKHVDSNIGYWTLERASSILKR
jgi:hypothetical protein